MKRVLVTGWAGFIGTNLIRHLIKHTDWQIFGMDALTYAAAPDWAIEAGNLHAHRFHDLGEQNIVSPSMIRDCFRRAEPDIVINLAAETHVCRSLDGPDKFMKTNFLGTYRLLEQMRIEKQAGRDIIFHQVSTDEVFGELGAVGQFHSKSRYEPRSPYAASKAAADHLVMAYHHSYGIDTRITNCSNNFGANQHGEKLIPKIIKSTMEGKPVTVYGSGTQVRDWIWVEDHCSGILAAIERGAPGSQYLLGGMCEKSNLEVISEVWDAMRDLCPDKPREIIHTNDRPTDDKRYAINIYETVKELGWKPKPELFMERLQWTAKWYLQRG